MGSTAEWSTEESISVHEGRVMRNTQSDQQTERTILNRDLSMCGTLIKGLLFMSSEFWKEEG